MSDRRHSDVAGEGTRSLGRTSLLRNVVLGAVVLVVLAVAAVYWNRSEPTPTRLTQRPVQVKSDGYVSSQACLECHAWEHQTWHASYHRTMTQIASPESVIGSFDGREVSADHVTAKFDRRGDDFWVRLSPIKGKVLEKPVVMTTGSHHMQVYWMSSGWQSELSMVPFVYLKEAQRWIPRRAAFLKDPRFQAADDLETGRWNGGCIRCHTTHGTPGLGDMQVNSRAAEFGIACEACHGPGENHVRYHKEDRTASVVDNIVNPSLLSHKKKSQVCGQCHGIYQLHDVADYFSNGVPFRPGEDLSEMATIGKYSEPETQYWNDGMARVSGREYNGLIDSPCYQGEEFSCLSCHTLHVPEDDPRELSEWANDQLQLNASSNQACTQCHEEYLDSEILTAHTHHATESSGSQCYNCHMPHTSYGLLKAIRSHQISSPDVKTSLDTGRPNACNLCHLDTTLEWTANNLERWYEVTPPTLSEDQKRTSAALLDLLTADAGGRALTAWHMGWKPAQEASGTAWIAPHLAQLLEDPYDAVRYISQRSLKGLPGYEGYSYDFVGPQEARAEARRKAVALWSAASKTVPKNYDAVLLDSNGQLRSKEMLRLLKTRSNRPVNLNE